MHAHMETPVLRCYTTFGVMMRSPVVRASSKLLRGPHLGGHKFYAAHDWYIPYLWALDSQKLSVLRNAEPSGVGNAGNAGHVGAQVTPTDRSGVVSAYNRGVCRHCRTMLFGGFAYSRTCSKRPAPSWKGALAARSNRLCERDR